MREVEAKFQIDDADQVGRVLRDRGFQLGAPFCQEDQAYAPVGWAYGDSKLGVPFVRLRTVDGRHTFTLKMPAENALACTEHETVVVNREAMHEAIIAMGFCPTVRIVKTRRVATADGLEICVDEVAGVGAFLEVERMVPDDVPAERVQSELVGFVRSLGIEAARTEETYDSLVRAAQLSAIPS